MDIRKNKRLSCFVPVEGQEEGLFDQTKTVDISKGGMGFLSQHEIPLDQEIAIEIDLIENGEPVFVIGKVQWAKQIPHSTNYRIGIAFTSVLRGSKSRLEKYFDQGA
jgi:hypothetical protein